MGHQSLNFLGLGSQFKGVGIICILGIFCALFVYELDTLVEFYRP